MNRLLWQGKILCSSKVCIGTGPLPALLGPGVWELLSCHTEPSRGQILSFQLAKGGKTIGGKSALCGGLWSLCKLLLWKASPFSSTTLFKLYSKLSLFLVRHGFPLPCKLGFFHSLVGGEEKKSTFSEEVDECSSRQLETATQQWLSYPILFPQVLNYKDSSSTILVICQAGIKKHYSPLAKFIASRYIEGHRALVQSTPALLPCIRFSGSEVFWAMFWCAPVPALQSWYC